MPWRVYLLNGTGARVLPSGPGVGAGVLACPWIMLGTLVGIMLGAMVPVITPWVGVKLHCGCVQQESLGSVTKVHCGGMPGYCGHLNCKIIQVQIFFLSYLGINVHFRFTLFIRKIKHVLTSIYARTLSSMSVHLKFSNFRNRIVKFYIAQSGVLILCDESWLYVLSFTCHCKCISLCWHHHIDICIGNHHSKFDLDCR